jgi:hypothetical protein
MLMEELTESVTFPVYALAKDCGDVLQFPSRRAMQGYLEAIDVENGEYEAWDGNGNVLHLSVAKSGSAWLNIVASKGRISDQEFSALRNRAGVPKGVRS